MSAIGKYWKAIFALLLVIAAVLVYFGGYVKNKNDHEKQVQQVKTMIAALEANILENMRYTDVQDDLEAENAKIVASRKDLYEHFPVEMKEEDQLVYVMYLETIFGTEIINWAFSKAQPMVALRDGSKLMGLTLTVNYETTYQGFKDMMNYLSTDSRVTSVQYANIQYDVQKDKATGTVTLLLYLVDSELQEYLPPIVPEPSTGKDNIYE